jgi:hypothetical protein
MDTHIDQGVALRPILLTKTDTATRNHPCARGTVSAQC